MIASRILQSLPCNGSLHSECNRRKWDYIQCPNLEVYLHTGPASRKTTAVSVSDRLDFICVVMLFTSVMFKVFKIRFVHRIILLMDVSSCSVELEHLRM